MATPLPGKHVTLNQIVGESGSVASICPIFTSPGVSSTSVGCVGFATGGSLTLTRFMYRTEMPAVVSSKTAGISFCAPRSSQILYTIRRSVLVIRGPMFVNLRLSSAILYAANGAMPTIVTLFGVVGLVLALVMVTVRFSSPAASRAARACSPRTAPCAPRWPT